MQFNTPSKESNASTPYRPRTRSVSSREELRETRRTLSLGSDDVNVAETFDYSSFVEGEA